MAQQAVTAVQNNFTKGLLTEFTGLNFPENAATDTSNCIYTLVGDVTRREGIDFEANYSTSEVNRTNSAISTYKWNNAGGDGQSQLIVTQIGSTLYFYRSSAATILNPLSTQILTGTVSLSNYLPIGSSNPVSTMECQYSSGNGYLFVYHPNLECFYCTYNPITYAITSAIITIEIRDFVGIYEPGVAVTTRPTTLTAEHQYNLQNQGWPNKPNWNANSTSYNLSNAGSLTWIIQTGLTITAGQTVFIVGYGYSGTYSQNYTAYMGGSVTSYNSTSGNITIDVNTSNAEGWGACTVWVFTSNANSAINTWYSDFTNYPANADVWWSYKDDTDAFNPSGTINNVSQPTSQAAQGSYILQAFNQNRSSVSGISGLTTISTLSRPNTGVFYSGRVFYTGINSSFAATGDAQYTTWTETIYFSTIIQTPQDFGTCYQTNDPTDENLFDLLPSDGGTIVIPGSGQIYRLFVISNGLLVFAANGVWFITGSTGIGFTATDYTITKISAVESISGTSFVDVNGLPMFWNEEGIYTVEPSQQGAGLVINPLTVGTILTFYNNIPKQSKKFVRGDYDPINYIIEWCYRSTNETSVTDRYQFDSILCFNIYNKAFYPYSISLPDTYPTYIHGINYVVGPGGSTSPDPVFKYLTSYYKGSNYYFTFSEENNTNYLDFESVDGVGTNFVSYFVTGYSLRGQALKKFQPQYIQMYVRTNGGASSYSLQGIWDYANTGNSGRWTTSQLVTIGIANNYDVYIKRHKIRGHGYALQLQVTSVDNMPFDIIGWATQDTINAGM